MLSEKTVPLAVKYRPWRFEDVVAQDEPVTLLSGLVSQEAPPPILLHGPPGTGKTSLAGIFALARHCAAPTPSPCGSCVDCKSGLTPFHWYEFSGSRHDEAKASKFAETMMSTVPWNKYGVFIDEVHGLQPGAADALLAEVERPRKGRFFICATTDIEAVRPALRSRCIIVPLKLVPKAELFDLAQRICRQERIAYEPGALDILVSVARGSARELVMALDAVATRGKLTPELLKSALSLGWTDQLLTYIEALLAGDLSGQFDALDMWPMPAREKARGIRELLLYLFNFEVSTPRVRNHVNAAFHLVGAEDRMRIASGLSARGRADGFKPDAYWQQLMNFWLVDPALIGDEASLAIKIHEFHRLTTRAGKVDITSADDAAARHQRKRQYRSRSKRAASSNEDQEKGPAVYSDHSDIERLAEAASFVGAHHGRLFNVSKDLRVIAPVERLERAASLAISKVTHELRLRINDWAGEKGDRSFHWIYRSYRSGNAIHCLLALHIPYEHMEAAERWLGGRSWKIDGADQVSIDATWHNPQPRNAKVRDISRLRFHWKRVRELWSGLDPAIEHWAADGTRKSLRHLLGLRAKPIPSEPMALKMVGVSHSLDRAARGEAEKKKMKLISAFKDAAWAHIDSGWELLEYRDRLSETAEREDQIRRVEHIGKDQSPLARKRYSEELENAFRHWPDDPRKRARTWTPWWSDSDIEN